MATDGDPIARLYDQQKEQHGRNATFLWLVLGGIAFIVDPESRLLSWQAAVFFIVGTFVAAILFGLIGYGATRVIAKLFIRARAPIAIVPLLGWSLFAIELVVIYFVARWLVRMMY